MRARQPRERVEHDDDVPADFDLPPGVLEEHFGDGDVPLVRQVEARGNHLSPAPVDQLAHLFGALVDQQQQELRLRMVERHALGQRLEHYGFACLRGRHDQRALPEAERAHEIHHALDLRGPWAGGVRRFEPQRPRGVHRAELRELGALREPCRGRAVHRRHAAIGEGHAVPAPQSRHPDCGIARRGEIAVRREAQVSALRSEIVPAGDGRHERWVKV